MSACISVLYLQNCIGCGTSARSRRTPGIQDHNAVFIFDQRSVRMAVADYGNIGLLRCEGKMQKRTVYVILMTVDEKNTRTVDIDDLLRRYGGIVITVAADGYDALAACFLQHLRVAAVIAEVENAVYILCLGNNAFCGSGAAVCIGKN